MSSASVGGGSKSNRPLIIGIAAVGVIAIIVGILWFTGAAPSFLNVGSHVHGSGKGHAFRGSAAVVVGLAALVYSAIMFRKSR